MGVASDGICNFLGWLAPLLVHAIPTSGPLLKLTFFEYCTAMSTTTPRPATPLCSPHFVLRVPLISGLRAAVKRHRAALLARLLAINFWIILLLHRRINGIRGCNLRLTTPRLWPPKATKRYCNKNNRDSKHFRGFHSAGGPISGNRLLTTNNGE